MPIPAHRVRARSSPVDAPQSFTEAPEVHARRRREILRAHPELRELAGPDPRSTLWIALLVAGQYGLAALAGGLPLGWTLALAWLVGAVLSHGLYVMVHECAHDLVLRGRRANLLLAILCDLPLTLPGAVAFRRYHRLHHGHLGELRMDPDLVSAFEARLVGRSRWRKALWIALMSLSQALRPLKVPAPGPAPGWMALDVAAVVAADVLIVLAFGPMALVYLIASTLFALGPHPLGGRWIQEHYVTRAGQETYSYYGPGNRIAFDIGFHNEHHDFPAVPWSRLRELNRRASSYYEGLASYRSWSRLLLRFVLDPRMTPYSRVARADRLVRKTSE